MIGPAAEPWAIVADCSLTRRKRYHAVFNPQGEPVFKSRILWDCVAYLDALGVIVYKLEPSDPKAARIVPKLEARKVP